jgi:oligo-1,6-glucosidase/alpha-glucosidase
MEPLKAADLPWWKKTTVYQIYPRSFQDSNGDGIGDLEGIISRLDYLKGLGIETIWFSPFYSSPQADFGYDISSYEDIAPEYGTMETAEKLIAEVHKRDMKIVFDMVMNHTSNQHPWFLESKSSKDNPKRDWYIWRDGKKPGGKAPPNNWRAMIGGGGWHYDATTDQWYWAQFLPFQPDLNYRCPELKQKMFDTVRMWLKKGVDGFRLDIINAVYEDASFADNPFRWKLLPSDEDAGFLFRSAMYTINHPDTYKFVKELRTVIEEFHDPPRYLVGEVTGPMQKLREYCGTDKPDGLNTVFLFKSLSLKLNAAKVKEAILEYEHHFPEPFIPTWVFGNHDRFRRISRLDDDPLKGKLNTALQLTARGVPYIYYGDEIGLPQSKFPIKTSLDAVALIYKNIPQFALNLVRKIGKESLNRDECRTPMQWNNSKNAGFTTEDATPWLPIHPNASVTNVQVEDADPDSLYHCYKRFLAIRKATPALHGGSIKILEYPNQPKDLLCYTRETLVGTDIQKVFVFLNFAAKTIQISTPKVNPKLLVSTTIHSHPLNGDEITLEPFEGIVIQ